MPARRSGRRPDLGASATEYVILVAGVALVLIAVFGGLIDKITGVFNAFIALALH